ncbi:UNVERIFIED_CONTAM: hypothetical protein K2H54_045417 [Gekko kuhli]
MFNSKKGIKNSFAMQRGICYLKAVSLSLEQDPELRKQSRARGFPTSADFWGPPQICSCGSADSPGTMRRANQKSEAGERSPSSPLQMEEDLSHNKPDNEHKPAVPSIQGKLVTAGGELRCL